MLFSSQKLNRLLWMRWTHDFLVSRLSRGQVKMGNILEIHRIDKRLQRFIRAQLRSVSSPLQPSGFLEIRHKKQQLFRIDTPVQTGIKKGCQRAAFKNSFTYLNILYLLILDYFLQLTTLTLAARSNEKLVNQKLCNTVLILDALYLCF